MVQSRDTDRKLLGERSGGRMRFVSVLWLSFVPCQKYATVEDLRAQNPRALQANAR
jgi:hypothetical protein